jgi:hypothetical protein
MRNLRLRRRPLGQQGGRRPRAGEVAAARSAQEAYA